MRSPADVPGKLDETEKHQGDRLNFAAFSLRCILLFSIAILLFVVLDSALRTPESTGRGAVLFRALGLSVPALIPSGRDARNPDGFDRRVDPRYSPFFPLPDPDPAEMVIRGRLQNTHDLPDFPPSVEIAGELSK